MRTTLLVLTGAAALAIAAPAAAQVYIGTDGPGVGVRIGPDHHHRRVYREYDNSYARGSCREERTRVTTDDGRVIYKTKRICD